MTTAREIRTDGAMTQLTRLREWMRSGRETVLGPRMLALVDWVDSKVVEFALQAGASELPVPRLIKHSVLERAGYSESFPASIVEESDGGCMPPATCYHCYTKLAATSLREPGVWTCIARCRRDEGEEESGRLQTFTMREVVFIGSAAWVWKQRQEWTDRIVAFAQSLDLVVT
jgi:seryl-tRNA synthetase